MTERNDINERFRIHDLNAEIARRINDELMCDPSHRYTGKWLGIANGQLVAVADTWGEVRNRLQEVEPDSFRWLLMEGVGMSEDEANAVHGA